MDNFEAELAALLNKYHFDTTCNLPNSILAAFVHNMLHELARTQHYHEV